MKKSLNGAHQAGLIALRIPLDILHNGAIGSPIENKGRLSVFPDIPVQLHDIHMF